MALLDMAARISQGKVRVFTLDTGRMPKQTYELMQEVRRRYGISIEAVFPDSAEVSAMVSRHGPNLFYDSVGKRKLCCEIRKVRPLERKLAELDAWMVGLRRAQAETRQSIRKVEIDAGSGGIYKLCPLPIGPKSKSGRTSAKTTCPIMSFIGRAIRRSAVRLARARPHPTNIIAPAAGGGKPKPTKSAAFTCHPADKCSAKWTSCSTRS